METLIRNCPNELNEEDKSAIAQRTEGYSGADIKSLCQEAALYPVREEINIMEVDKLRPIKYSDFDNSLKNIRPSVGQESIKAYEDWNKMFGSFN